MKKLVIVLIAVISLTSCQLKEEIYFNKDGSGTYNLTIDMSGLMAMKGMKNDSLKSDKQPEVKDTIIRFSDILKDKKDSIAKLDKEQRDLIENMKNLSIRIYLDEANDKMEMSYIYPFKKTADIDNILQNISKLDKEKKNSPMGDVTKELPNEGVRYHINKRRFHREVTLNKVAKEKDTTNNKQLEQMMGMFQYEIVYHFPRRIKKVTYSEEALLGTDGKTLHIKVPISKALNNSKLLDFEVEFE